MPKPANKERNNELNELPTQKMQLKGAIKFSHDPYMDSCTSPDDFSHYMNVLTSSGPARSSPRPAWTIFQLTYPAFLADVACHNGHNIVPAPARRLVRRP